MAITAAVCNSYRLETAQGTHLLGTDALKLALYSPTATLNKSTTVYSSTGEVVAGGYTAGGIALTTTVALSGDVTTIDFGDVSWSAAITARGALIYNTSRSNKAVAVLDFGSTKTSTTTFTITFPAADADNAILRFL